LKVGNACIALTTFLVHNLRASEIEQVDVRLKMLKLILSHLQLGRGKCVYLYATLVINLESVQFHTLALQLKYVPTLPRIYSI